MFLHTILFKVFSYISNDFHTRKKIKEALSIDIYETIVYDLRKVVIGCVTCSGHNQVRNPRAWIFTFWSKTDMDPLKQNLCLAPDQKIVATKKVANDQKINLAS